MAIFPDILHAEPTRRIDWERTRLAITMAFAGASSVGLFSEALDTAAVAPSNWRPSEFAAELFLERFVAQCFRVSIRGKQPVMNARHLYRLLSQPPADPGVVQFRRQILFELTNDAPLRTELEGLYADLCRLRGLLENPAAIRVWDANRRRLDILHLLKSL